MFVFARKEFVTYKKTAVKSNLKEIILVNVFAVKVILMTMNKMNAKNVQSIGKIKLNKIV